MEKITGDQRREQLLQWLRASSAPITGTELAERAGVSRQVIVGDMTLLKAKNTPIVATSRGYMYLQEVASARYIRQVACRHTPERTEEELYLLVDHGVTVIDVKVEHEVYGELTASLHLRSRKDVEAFLQSIQSASLLSELTDGYHVHTLQAPTEDVVEKAILALEKHGFLAN
ncbi:transcription repressor NadR [Bacillus fonticola]|uniref:transcription repressor NadR n=1 Tax=Bacillus fonticola TaxID=2728853 RepID=UPI0014747D7D|nr:transcription repressor NadR [Bacillus fonticola]